MEQGPARNRRTFVRKLDERVIKLRKKHCWPRQDYTSCSCPHDDGYTSVILRVEEGREGGGVKERADEPFVFPGNNSGTNV